MMRIRSWRERQGHLACVFLIGLAVQVAIGVDYFWLHLISDRARRVVGIVGRSSRARRDRGELDLSVQLLARADGARRSHSDSHGGDPCERCAVQPIARRGRDRGVRVRLPVRVSGRVRVDLRRGTSRR